jgi:hypothetical protein
MFYFGKAISFFQDLHLQYGVLLFIATLSPGIHCIASTTITIVQRDSPGQVV